MADVFLKTKADIDRYVKEKNIFPYSSVLTIENLREIKASVEGFVNPIYRIRDAHRSVIMKQITMQPISRNDENDAHLKDWTLDVKRIRNEIVVLIYWNTIFPGICPDVYFLDESAGVIIMEDLSHLSLLRYEMARLQRQNQLGEKLGIFFARNLFYSSEFCLTDYKREALLRFFENPEYNALEQFLYEECSIVSDHRVMPEATMPLRRSIIANKTIQTEISRLKSLFLNKKECVIHTDLHSSNIMVNRDDVKIIDTEFAGFGPVAHDFGRLTASFCLNYFSLFTDDEHLYNERTDYQTYLFDTLRRFYSSFEEEFMRLCENNKEDSLSLRHLDIKAYFNEMFVDTMSFTALNAASRIATRGLSYDLKRLPEEKRIYPIMLVLHFCEDILSKEVRLSNIDELIDYLKLLPECFPNNE